LTKWKMLGFAHTKDLKFSQITNTLVTQKELMVMPNAPRFFRENDKISFTTKISNLSDKDLNGKVELKNANINYAGNAAAQIAYEHIVQVTLHPRHFVLVGANAIQIGAVRSREQIAGLKEVNVSVDVTRQNDLAGAIDLFPERRRVLLAHRDAFDLVAVDYHRRIRQHLAVGGIDHGRANERNPLRAKRRGKE